MTADSNAANVQVGDDNSAGNSQRRPSVRTPSTSRWATPTPRRTPDRYDARRCQHPGRRRQQRRQRPDWHDIGYVPPPSRSATTTCPATSRRRDRRACRASFRSATATPPPTPSRTAARRLRLLIVQNGNDNTAANVQGAETVTLEVLGVPVSTRGLARQRFRPRLSSSPANDNNAVNVQGGSIDVDFQCDWEP